MGMRQARIALIVWLVTCVPYQTAVIRGQAGPTEIGPPDVFALVGLLRDELELVRFVMGRPSNEQRELAVTGAAPREAYFQALTMLAKADRLCFEHTRERGQPVDPPEGDIRPIDVYRVVEATLDRVHRVKRHLGLEAEAVPHARDPGRTPTDVFRSTVQANRQLNLLLEQRFAPSDVFLQVTIGVGYAARLLEQSPVEHIVPPEPAFEPGKRPGDVYRRLLECFARIRRIAQMSGLQMLVLETDEERVADAEPSDVYDIASLLVSELAFLHAQVPGLPAPRPVYFVGRKFPSDVYQRAGILEAQLVDLEALVAVQPDWLTRAAQ